MQILWDDIGVFMIIGVDLPLQPWTYRYNFRATEKSGLIVTVWTYRYRCGLIVTTVDLSLQFSSNGKKWTYRYSVDLSLQLAKFYSFRVREKSGLIVTLWTYRYRCMLFHVILLKRAVLY